MISTLNVRGGNHERCEDSVFIKETEDFIYGGVFDGCSTGKNSSWASQTLAYLFEKYCTSNPVNDDTSKLVYLELLGIKRTLGLTEMNFLSTCILFTYYKKLKILEVRVFGDGFYYVNDVEYEIEQDNKPKYFGYLLRNDEIDLNAVQDGLDRYPTKYFNNVDSFRICSDGIKSINRSQFLEPAKNDEPLKLLFHPPQSENYLQRMWNILKRDGYTISDDLSIISYVQD